MSADYGAQMQKGDLISDEPGGWMATGGRGHVNPIDEIFFIAEYALSGVSGFALGGLLWGLLQIFYPGFTGGPYSGILFWLAGGLIFGFTGGYLLDILPKNRLKMAAFSAAGYAIGLAFMVVAVELIMKGTHIPGGIIFATGIIVVGFVFGLPLKRSKLFALLGAAGFVVGGALGLSMYHASIYLNHSALIPFLGWLPGLAMLVGLGIGTGAVMGLGKYILETI